MNGYLTSMMNILMEWVRSLTASVWNLLSGSPGTGLLAYVTEHWKGILLALLLTGALVDLAVYLFRWRPYLVWASFIRRMREGGQGKRGAEPDPEEDRAQVPELLPEEPARPALPPADHSGVRHRRSTAPAASPTSFTDGFSATRTYGTPADAAPVPEAPVRRRRRRRE